MGVLGAHVWGGGGNSKHFPLLKKYNKRGSPNFEKSHAKFQDQRTNPSVFWEKSYRIRKKDEREPNNNSGHYVMPKTPKGSASTSLGPKLRIVVLQVLIGVLRHQNQS